MSSVIDFGIRISQKLTGDDAVAKLAKLEQGIGKQTDTIAKMENKLGSARKALTALMDGGASGKSVSIAAVDKMRESIAKLEGDIGKQKGGLGQMMAGLGDAKGAASAQTALQEAAAMAGPIAAVTAVVAGLVLALGVLTLSLARFSLESANAARTHGIVMTALTGSTLAAEANEDAIARVADSTALAKGQIQEIGNRLAVAGIDGQRFENTLQTISLATALLGASAGSHLEGIIEKSKAIGHFQFNDRQLKGLGISFGDLAAQLGMTAPAFKAAMKAGKVSVEQGVDAINTAISKRFGGGGAAMMLDFNVQVMKLHEHLSGLVKSVNIEPFLAAMKDLLSVFDRNTASGAVMHFMFTKVFDALFAGVAKIEPYAKAFFHGMLIATLLVYIGIVKLKRILEDTFGGSSILSGIDGITIAMYAGVAVMGIMLGVVALLTAAVIILAAVMLAPFLPVIAVMLVMYGAFKLGEAAVNSFAATIGGFTLPDLGASGTSMVDGLVNAVNAGADRFAAAMKGLGQSGMDALNSIFHFGSPSKAMEQRGEWIDEGGARGVEGGAMRKAMAGMASPADASGDASAKAGNRNAYISITVGGASKEERKSLLAEMTDALEAAGIMVGVGAEPEPA